MTDTIRPDEPGVEGNHPTGDGPRARMTLWWAIGLAFVAVVGLIAVTSGDNDEAAPNALVDFEFQTESGDIVTLADFAGTPLVVNYFAAWCPACRAELPDFEEVHQEVGEEVVFLGVSRDNVTSAWLNLVDDFGLTYDTVFEGNVAGSFAFVNARAMPTTMFISADGTVEQVFSGPLNDTVLRELIAEHFT